MSVVKIRAAFENALNAMVGMVPNVAIASSSRGVFTTATPHGFTSTVSVNIVGHNAAIDGIYFIVVTGPSTFTLQSIITKAPFTTTASAVGGVLSANLTAWEGVAFTTTPGVPYQRVNLIMGTPETPVYGGKFSREIGFFQLTLYYPVQRGTAAIMTRAELIRSTFPRGSSFSNGGVVVNIPRKPEIFPTILSEEVITTVVRIPYWADIFN